MKNVKRVLAIVLAVCTIAVLFTACGKSPQKQIIGKWTESSGVFAMEFHEENIITYEVLNNQTQSSLLSGLVGMVNDLVAKNIKGSYSIEKKDDGKYYITITFSSLASISGEYLLEFEGQTLTLKDPSTSEAKFVLYRQTDEPSSSNN